MLRLNRAARRLFSTNVWKVDNPYTGAITEFKIDSDETMLAKTQQAQSTFKKIKGMPLNERIEIVKRFMAEMEKNKDAIAQDLTACVGKPLQQSYNEIAGCYQRINALIKIAPQALQDDLITEWPTSSADVTTSTVYKKISKEPVGVVLLLVPWNYPMLCTVNGMITSILSNNAVLVKHNERTTVISQWFEKCMNAAYESAPLYTNLNITHDQVAKLVQNPVIQYVGFTGSVNGGRAVYSQVAKHRFIDVGLELGGKDGCYVSDKANIAHAIENVTDGALYNAGQSCCSVERIFVHDKVYDQFIDGVTSLLKTYKIGNPLDKATNLGPLAQAAAPTFLKSQVDDAVSKGAKLISGGKPTVDAAGKGRFFEPTLITNIDPSMNIFKYENFGPIVNVMRVANDQQAVELLNNSAFGLTGSIWSEDFEHAQSLMKQINVGTVYMNRCDVLDPELPWAGRQDSGKGAMLSKYGFNSVTKLKGYNFRPKTQ